jgi:hypothetical protein
LREREIAHSLLSVCVRSFLVSRRRTQNRNRCLMSRLNLLSRFSRIGLPLLAGIVLVGLAGCSGGTGKLNPVEGDVTVDGVPLSDGEIAFFPEGEGKKAFSITGKVANGKYKMTTNGKDGVPAGKYKVTVNTIVAKPTGTGDAISNPTPVPGGGAPQQQRKAAEKYETPAQTPLMVEVPGGDFNLKLTRN